MLMQQIKANHAKSCYHTFMGSLCHFQHINIFGALPNALLYMLPYILNGTSTYMHPFQCATAITIKFSRKYIMSQFPPSLKLGGGGD